MATACRPSFNSTSSYRSLRECPPRKVRRSCEGSSRGSTEAFGRLTEREELYLAILPLDFGASEFLPLDFAEKLETKKHSSVNFDLDKLSDDMLGRCLFNGFLDTFETSRLMACSKRIREVGRNQVQRLDLRKCGRLTTDQVEHLASSFENLTVSSTTTS